MRLRYRIYLTIFILGSVFALGRCGRSRTGPNAILPPVLPANDKEQITINPENHTISILTPFGLKTETLPDRPSKIDIEQNGTAKVTASQMGFEARPFIGLGVGEGVRCYAGADLGYIKKLDLGLGLVSPKLSGGSSIGDIRVGLFGSYNIWSNTRMTVGFDNQKTVHALLSVRL